MTKIVEVNKEEALRDIEKFLNIINNSKTWNDDCKAWNDAEKTQNS